MKQLGYLVVSLSLLLAVVVKQGPDAQLSGRQAVTAVAETAPGQLDPEMAIGWALAGSLLASVLMGGLVYRYSLREFETWTQIRPRSAALEPSRFGRMDDPRDARAA
jgi:hypothetical protein